MFYKKKQEQEKDNDKSNKKKPLAGNVKIDEPVYKQEIYKGMQQDGAGPDKQIIHKWRLLSGSKIREETNLYR